MKRVVILAVLLLSGLGLTFVTAEGQQDPDRDSRGMGWLNEEPSEEDLITLTGELFYNNRIHPELISGSDEYELMVPHFYVYDLNLKDGQTVTVEGYKIDDALCPMESAEEEEETHIRVTKAVIDGKEYDLDDYDTRGGMFGMMGQRGSRGGRMMGANSRNFSNRAQAPGFKR